MACSGEKTRLRLVCDLSGVPYALLLREQILHLKAQHDHLLQAHAVAMAVRPQPDD